MLHDKLIKREDIRAVFNALAVAYEQIGGNQRKDIYLVGGSAIILEFNYRFATVDIDAYFNDDEKLTYAIEKVSLELNLPKDWLNHDFVLTPSYSPQIIEKAELFSQFGKYIYVYSLNHKYLIAMKLKSSRPTGGDLDDIIKMIYELRYKKIDITYEEIINAYKDLYPDFSNTYDFFLEKAKEAFSTPIEDFKYLFETNIE